MNHSLPYRGHIAVLLLALGTLCACAPKQITLFSQSPIATDSVSVRTIPAPPAFRLAAGDEVSIEFMGIDEQTVSPLNIGGSRYTITADGSITLPVLGHITLQGMTTEQAEMTLRQAAQQHLKDPIVRVLITNAHITIIGEVRNAGTFAITQPVPLLTALGMANDLTSNARRDNLLIQRQENGQIRQYRINLLSDDLFSSPCYYLQKGDIVYVSPRHDTLKR